MILLTLLLACGQPEAPTSEAPPVSVAPAAQPAEVATPSLYELDLQLVDQTGAARGLDLHRGHPVLVSMFYSSCPQACPMLIAQLQSIEAQADPAARAGLRTVLVSFDPERDDPATLTALVERHGLDDRWTLASAPEPQVRELAAVLDIPYRRLPTGDYNHASVITLLDGEGRVVARLDGASADPQPLLEALRGVAQGT